MKKISVLTALLVSLSLSVTGLAMAQSVDQARGSAASVKAYGEVQLSGDGIRFVAPTAQAAIPEIKEIPPVESID